MDNIDKYNKVFIDSFSVTQADLEGLEYQSIEQWDSVGHMSLITMLEDTFGIMMDTDDIIDFSSYKKGKEILAKYDLSL